MMTADDGFAGVCVRLAIAAGEEIAAEDSISFGDFRDAAQVATFGAHFVELAVHALTGEIRRRRKLAGP